MDSGKICPDVKIIEEVAAGVSNKAIADFGTASAEIYPINGPVVCDTEGCGWQSEILTLEGMMVWHNVKCPKCNDCIIINDEELMMLENTIIMEKSANAVGLSLGPKPGTPEEELVRIKIAAR